jgi:ubiquinone/menaquinone biosynthesis C-methylase UbiE
MEKNKRKCMKCMGWAPRAGKVRANRRVQYFFKLKNMNYDCEILEIGCGTGLVTEKVMQE